MGELSPKPSLLLVEDDAAVMDAIGLIIEDNYEVTCAASKAEAIELLDSNQYQLALLDKNLPDGTGLDIAEHIVEQGLASEIILMTAFGSLESAKHAMRLGVHEYLEKPFANPDIVLMCLDRAAQAHQLKREKRKLMAELTRKNHMFEEMSVRDFTTRLFNHEYLQRAIDLEIDRSSRYRLEFSVLLCDLDNFAAVNSTQGSKEGDRLLRHVGELISGKSRTIDLPFEPAPTAVAARFGGNTFALVLPQTTKHGAATVAERLRSAVAKYDFSSVGLPQQTVSVGFATYPEDSRERGGLISAVEAAKRAAKTQGRDCVIAYDPSLDTGTGSKPTRDGRAEHARALRDAIRDNALDHAFQPVVLAEDQTIVAYEALVRPRAPFPDPPTLINTAVLSGQTLALGRAIRAGMMSLLDEVPDHIQLFTNLHPDELRVELADEPSMAKCRHRIVLELTEVAKIRDYDRVSGVLKDLRAAGFGIALDDLGAGYSGLNSLALLEPDFVKLDIELVRAAATSPRSARLARHLVEFCAGEGMQVVAEGIETDTEFEMLRDLGCSLMQGYRFGRPAPLSALSR